ncbi:hypothetical protein M378DRAFT_171003 [Amanita muscaria Koide BX008]|uniref:Uncharacterized protein n=1 Tax=Amanita muscaria (strain Koide BX008) TaxID=946122 RepID=A0A0C2SVM0_AMAMK|nr:hypothetical protein M378DRAFT_171003 [Amanita muscaria Koide BX008]
MYTMRINASPATYEDDGEAYITDEAASQHLVTNELNNTLHHSLAVPTCLRSQCCW